jgi:hypothetical protein
MRWKRPKFPERGVMIIVAACWALGVIVLLAQCGHAH